MSNPDIGRSCMLVNAAEMLKKAEAGHYALGAFNTNNLEWTLGRSPGRRGGEVPADSSVHRWCC